MRVRLSLRTYRLARLPCSGAAYEDFWLMYNNVFLQRFDYIRETNTEFEVHFPLLPPTLPLLVFKKRFFFAALSVPVWTIQTGFVLFRVRIVTLSLSEHRT